MARALLFGRYEEEVEQKAEETLKEYMLIPPFTTERLLKELDGTMEYVDEGDVHIIHYYPHKFKLFLSKSRLLDGNNEKEEVAIMVGHLIMHAGYLKKYESGMFAKRNKMDEMDIKADLFGLALLMPREDFIEKVMTLGSDYEALAQYYECSVNNVIRRCYDLGLQ